jgi:hypothetical protein
MTSDDELRADIVLSVNGALLGSVTPNLRGVAVDWDDSSIRVVCYFHGSISEEDQEIMDCVHTEVATDFVDARTVELSTKRLDKPTKMDGLRAFVFERRE